MTLLLYIVCSVLALRLLVALAHWFPAIGVFLRALFLWVVRPIEILAHAAGKCAVVCYLGYQSRLHLPPQPLTYRDDVDAPLLNLISRLVMFIVSICIIIGDLELARYRQVTLFHLLLTSKADIPYQDYAAAAMWVCASMIFGFFLCEALNIMPRGIHVLTLHSRWMRFVVGFVSFLLLVGSIVLMAVFYGYGQGVILQQPDDIDLAITLTTCFGFIMGCASVGALWLIKIGISAVLCLFCGSLYAIACSINLAFQFLIGTIESFVTIAPKHSTQPLDEASNPSFPITTTDTTTKEELPLKNEKQDITVLGYGAFAYRMVPTLLTSARVHGVTPYIRQAGVLDLSRSYEQTGALPLTPGIAPLAPSIAAIHYAQANEAIEEALTKLASSIHNTAVENTHIKHTGTTIVVCDLALIPAIAPALVMHKNRVPKQTFILLMQQPTKEEYERNVAAQTALQGLLQGPDRVFSSCILTSPMSEGMLRNGIQKADEALAQPLMNMCIAPLHAPMNVTIGEALSRLPQDEIYAGLAFAVAPVATQKIAPAWNFFKLFAPNAGERGIGDYEDLVSQIKNVTREVVTNAATSVTLAPLNPTMPRIIVYSVPLRTTDKRYTELCDFIHYYTNTTYPGTTAIITQANGTTLTGMKHGYKVQATAIYPVSHLLPQAQPLAQVPSTAVVEADPPKKTNGNKRVAESM